MSSYLNSNFKKFLILEAALLTCTAVFLSLIQYKLPLDSIDLIQYWSAATLWLEGLNPYDPVLMSKVQSTADAWPTSSQELPIIMYNPPIILPLISWMAIFDFQTLKIIWFLFTIFCLSLLAPLILKLDRKAQILLLVFLCIFPAIRNQIFYGQISIVMFLGLFIYSQYKKTKPILSGASLSLTLLKPHLFFIFYLYIGIRAFAQRRTTTIVSLLIASTLLLTASTLTQENIFNDYLTLFENPPEKIWINMALPTLVKIFYEVDIQFAILALGMGLYTLLYYQQSEGICSQELTALLFSISFSAYYWPYDLLAILPAFIMFILSMSSKIQISLLTIVLAAISPCILSFSAYEDYWITPLMIIVIFFTTNTKHQITSRHNQCL